MRGDVLITEKEMGRGVSLLEKSFHPLFFSPPKSHLSLYLFLKKRPLPQWKQQPFFADLKKATLDLN